MARVAFGVIVLAMDVAVKDGDVLIGGEQVHYVVAVGSKPLPFGLEIKQRAVREDDDRRGLGKARQVFFQPRQLIWADFRLCARYVIESDEVNSGVIE